MSKRAKRWLLPLATLGMMAGILLGRGCADWLYPAAALGVTVLGLLIGGRRLRLALLVLMAACVGCLTGWQAYHPTLPEDGVHEIVGVVAEEIRTGDRGQIKTVLRNVRIDGQPFPAGVYWSCYPKEVPEDLMPGVTVHLTARTYAPSAADNPGGYDFREYLLQKGVTLGVYGDGGLTITREQFSISGFAAGLRVQLTQGLVDVMGEEAGGYAATMLLGARDRVPDEDRQAFVSMGIAHILSVSGYHVGVLTMLVSFLLRLVPIGKRRRRYVQLGVLLVLLPAYCLLTGMNPPVVRASLLVVLALAVRIRGRQPSQLHLLCLSACLILLIRPAQLTSVSFQLTYGALLGITLISPWLKAHLPVPLHYRRLREALSLGVSAQLGLLLPELYWFHEIPLLGILFNLVVMLLAQGLLAVYWLTLALLGVPYVGALLGGISRLMTGVMLAVVRWIGAFDFLTLWTRQATLWTALGCVLMVLGMSWLIRGDGWKRWLALGVGVCCTVLSLICWPSGATTYVQLSVGSADAAVLSDCGHVTVIDTGEDGQALSTYLHQRRMSVDNLILTHLHRDHAGGLAALLEDRIPVRRLYLPAKALEGDATADVLALIERLRERGTEIIYVTRGDVIDLPSGQMTVLWPEAEHIRRGQDANVYSMVLRAELRGTTMLLTGDIDGKYEMYAALPADILKVAHHGSGSSTSPAFLEAVSPQLLVLSCGDDSRQEAMTERAGDIPIYGTREHGAVTIELAEDGYKVYGMR